MGVLLPGQRRFKRRRRVMALEDEMKILDNLEEGVSKGGVGRPLGVSQATTRILKQNEKAIRASIFRHLLQMKPEIREQETLKIKWQREFPSQPRGSWSDSLTTAP